MAVAAGLVVLTVDHANLDGQVAAGQQVLDCMPILTVDRWELFAD